MEQFFGKTTWRVLVGVAIMTLFGGVVLRMPQVHVVMLCLTALAGAWTYWKHPEMAFVLVFAELFSFSHGKLFETSISGFVVTSRMALFVGIMLSWGAQWLLGRVRPLQSSRFWSPWIVLAMGLVVGLVVGVLKNDLPAVLDDMNAYLFTLYLLPLTSITWTRERQHQIIQTFVACALWMSVLSLSLLYVFTHLSNEILQMMYTFIRDARIGELTLMEGGYWRVFLQSQIILIPVLLLGLTFDVAFQKRDRSRWVLIGFLSLLMAGLLISLSRSFWLGCVVAVPFLAWQWVRGKEVRLVLKRLGGWFASAVVALGLLALVALMSFPVPSRVLNFQETFKSRTTEAGDLAVSSRWNLLPVMIEGIRSEPVFGLGFGRELAFVSDDPRVRAIYPDGKWRTYKFEWGWLDLWVKMGIFGFVGYLMVFWGYDRLIKESVSQPAWMRLGWRATLLALVGAHFFSPYLNHPLGIGILLVVTVFLDQSSKEMKESVVVREAHYRPSIAASLIQAAYEIDPS